MRILIIDDDKKLCDTLQYQFEKTGFSVDLCHDGQEGLYLVEQVSYDVILLDRMLPPMDGITVLKKIRRKNISTPILLVTALGELSDRIAGLDCGADDYIVKPFEFEELLARIRCIIRRPGKWVEHDKLSFGDLTYDVTQKQLSGNGQTVVLSRREGELIEMFLRNPGNTLPRETILSKVWGPGADVEDGNLDNYIHFIRRRLKSTSRTLTLKTVHGVGYRLEETHV